MGRQSDGAILQLAPVVSIKLAKMLDFKFLAPQVVKF
jgi:hypothetical protein